MAVARAALSRFAHDTARYAVVAAVSDIDRALAFLATETVDVVVLDLELPGTSGIDGLPAVMAAAGGAPVLVVSGLAGPGAAEPGPRPRARRCRHAGKARARRLLPWLR
ncbi:response regulator [Sphingomonas sp. MMS24-JH45]